jgi:RHS repeat-associated protein
MSVLSYDSWGKLILIDGTLKDTVGVKNPYRYRGYRYDTETGLYYLQSRYYNPEWGRFINNDSIAGSVGELLGHNIFAYCKNSPVNSSDPSGFRETRGAINPDGDYDGVGKKAYKKVTETTVGKKARAIKSAAMQNIKHPYKKAKSIMNKSGTSIAIHDAVVNDGIAAMTFAITSELHISDKAALGISLGIGIVQVLLMELLMVIMMLLLLLQM